MIIFHLSDPQRIILLLYKRKSQLLCNRINDFSYVYPYSLTLETPKTTPCLMQLSSWKRNIYDQVLKQSRGLEEHCKGFNLLCLFWSVFLLRYKCRESARAHFPKRRVGEINQVLSTHFLNKCFHLLKSVSWSRYDMPPLNKMLNQEKM